LIIFDPRAPRENRGLVRKELVLNVDLPATILDLAGARVPGAMQGRSLRPLLGRSRPAWRGEIFCEELWDNPEIPQSECVRTDRWKYIQYPKHADYSELFDLVDDPQEKHNLAGEARCAATLEDLRDRCRGWIRRLVDAQRRFRE
jgi:arylsulfatase A-like enzyme